MKVSEEYKSRWRVLKVGWIFVGLMVVFLIGTFIAKKNSVLYWLLFMAWGISAYYAFINLINVAKWLKRKKQ